MSSAPTEAPEEGADSSPPCQPPQTRAVLPVVQLSDEHPWLRVYYSEQDAVVAAQASPRSDCIDIRGIAMESVCDEEGSMSLQARQNGSPDDPRARVMAALRATVDLPEHDEETLKELRESLQWLERAPDLASLVSGLGYGPVTYLTDFTCQRGCSPWMRTHPHSGPPCCPGA